MTSKELKGFLWVSERGQMAMMHAVWMTWYKARWPWVWLDIPFAPAAAVHVNWKTYTVFHGAV